MHRDAIARFSSLDEWGRRTYTYIHTYTHIYMCIELTRVWREEGGEREMVGGIGRVQDREKGERRVRLGRRAEAEGWVGGGR